MSVTVTRPVNLTDAEEMDELFARMRRKAIGNGATFFPIGSVIKVTGGEYEGRIGIVVGTGDLDKEYNCVFIVAGDYDDDDLTDQYISHDKMRLYSPPSKTRRSRAASDVEAAEDAPDAVPAPEDRLAGSRRIDV